MSIVLIVASAEEPVDDDRIMDYLNSVKSVVAGQYYEFKIFCKPIVNANFKVKLYHLVCDIDIPKGHLIQLNVPDRDPTPEEIPELERIHSELYKDIFEHIPPLGQIDYHVCEIDDLRLSVTEWPIDLDRWNRYAITDLRSQMHRVDRTQ